MDSSSHLLALKVMRVSRPSLLGQWQPFAEASTHFDAHNASSITSIQPHIPNKQHVPTTIRDLSALSQNLSLPSSFGSISLGETFSSCFCVANMTNYDIEGVHIRVEMQSASAKSLLLELGGPEHRLGPLGTLEGVVQSEIKELGQHTLSCIVHYRVPPGLRPPAPSDDPSDPRAQLFRKHYRFPVSNPFSVKTKVHTPKSPSALMSRVEREKLFLQIDVQNLTQESMWFERLEFKPVDGWTFTDANESSIEARQAFTGPKTLVQPQDTFQYIYTLIPAVIPRFLIKPAPGAVIPLGRLDIAWRTTFGEPGRLLTSMLSRRVPQAPPPPIQSALPPHVQRVIGQIQRPQSPANVPQSPSSLSRPSSPVPYKSRQPNRPQTPVQQVPTPQPIAPLTDIEVDLVVETIPNVHTITLDQPFAIHFELTTAAFVPSNKQRIIRLAAQHTIRSRRKPGQNAKPTAKSNVHESKVMAAHSPTPSTTSTPRVLSLDFHPKVVESPRKHSKFDHSLDRTCISFPSPYVNDLSTPIDADATPGTGLIEFVGSSLVKLQPVTLTADCDTIGAQVAGEDKRISSQKFRLDFLPHRVGHANVGGVRILLLGDEEREIDGEHQHEVADRDRKEGQRLLDRGGDRQTAKILQEWSVVAELLVGIT
ncbi:SubName: Full=Uncharacterized protein {ECO:0000313/EMBL:CCA72601.1} [Serendipita indica DSM 11827]|nr:SubName: Full=Uncharacterized protein {ECO:0000313/EMBL:CCA72601.1} [Serendipita indica DSM 11827]